ncbi:MAG: co-chaperone GroES family protein [Bacteroidia bacterium]|nr:co-chaperone GroES family protein [Bacteroidia bacterium]
MVAHLDKLIIIGDRVLIKPKTPADKTPSGLFLPPGIQEKEKIQSGYVVRTGPGYPVPFPAEDPEPWKEPRDPVRYIPLQVQEGDLALFLQKDAYEIQYEGEKYYIVPQHGILMVERDEQLFD